MASNAKFFWISESGWRSLSSLRDSIKLLFNVDISLKESDAVKAHDTEETAENEDCRFFMDYITPQKGSICVLMETDGPFENIEKAQKFSCACFPSSPKYKISIQLGNSNVFEIVHRRSTHIQQSTASLFKFDPLNFELTIQGYESCVELARKELEMILRDAVPKDALSEVNISHTQQISPDEQDSERVSPRDIFQIESSRISGPVDDGDCLCNDDLDSDIETDGCINNRLKNVESQMHLNIPASRDDHHPVNSEQSASSSSAAESDDDNNVVNNNVLTDPRNSKYVEKAVKLGYSPKQIQTALKNLVTGCSSEDLLSELVKIGNEKSESKTSDSFDGPISLHGLSLASTNENTSPQRSLQGGNNNLNASDNLRSIIIDGSNVAMSHGRDRFSCEGIKIAVDWFRQRGHKDITVFVPQWRKEASRPDAPIEGQHILHELERERIVSFTPARRVNGRRVVSYDDRYVLKHAVEVDGIVVSNDTYRDLVRENEGYRKVVDERLLMYTFVKDKFMPPDDPLGRQGPYIDDFLRKVPAEPAPRPQDCPYGKKCTYGNKCRFYHPERGTAFQKSIRDTLEEQAKISRKEIASGKLDLASSEKGKRQKQKLARTKSLVPGEPLPYSFTSESAPSQDGHRPKPKLGHSKSLVCPSKTGDYLTASRLKLEEAESEKSFQSSPDSDMDLKAFLGMTKKTQKGRKGSGDNGCSYSPSPRTSPGLPSELPLAGSGSNKTKTTLLGFAHLAVPSVQPQESYTSGHLSVAKKLSDEGSEKNFFMGSKSKSPSPTSSLLDEISPVDDLKDTTDYASVQPNPNSFTRDTIPGTELLTSQRLCTNLTQDNYPFENNRYDDNSAYRYFMDSGNVSMYGSPQPPMSPQSFQSFPPSFKKERSRQGHQSLHRSLSSSHNMRPHETVTRRSSDAIGVKGNVPPHTHHYNKAPAPFMTPGIFQCQNSSSTPDIHAWRESGDGGSIDFSASSGVYHSDPTPGTDVLPLSFSHNLPRQPILSMEQNLSHQPNIRYGMDQFHRTPITRPPLAGDQSYILPCYSYSPVNPVNMMEDHHFPQGFYRPVAPLHPHLTPHQPMYVSPTPVHRRPDGMTSPSHYYPLQGQPVYNQQSGEFRNYGFSSMVNKNQLSRPQIPQSQYQPGVSQAASHAGQMMNPGGFHQNAPILPDDSRYESYCRLTPMYGEKIVRNVMNLHPDIKDDCQLMTVIGQYQMDRGLGL